MKRKQAHAVTLYKDQSNSVDEICHALQIGQRTLLSVCYCTCGVTHTETYVAVRRSHGSCCMEACAKSIDVHQW